MFIRIQQPALRTWKRVSNILTNLWTKFYQPFPSIDMPRTRRRHHSRSRSRSSAAYREKRRRVETSDSSRKSVSRLVQKYADSTDGQQNAKSSYDRSSRRKTERSKRSHHRRSLTSGRKGYRHRYRDERSHSNLRRRHRERERAKEREDRISPSKVKIFHYICRKM